MWHRHMKRAHAFGTMAPIEYQPGLYAAVPCSRHFVLRAVRRRCEQSIVHRMVAREADICDPISHMQFSWDSLLYVTIICTVKPRKHPTVIFDMSSASPCVWLRNQVTESASVSWPISIPMCIDIPFKSRTNFEQFKSLLRRRRLRRIQWRDGEWKERRKRGNREK
jgi:hypothetical protein